MKYILLMPDKNIKKFLKRKVLESFKPKQRKDITKYKHALNLFKSRLMRKEVLTRAKISIDQFYGWKYQRSKPVSMKTLEEFKEKYVKNYSKEELQTISYLVGYNLGDGNISRNFCNTWFYGVYEDIKNMKILFYKFNVRPIVYKYKINNGKMAIHDRLFSRLLFCFGAIPGNKTTSKIRVPEWILNSKEKIIKIKFLQGLFDSELSKISVMKGKNAYQSLKFYQSKEIRLVEEGKIFLNQIRDIIKEFEIKTSEIYFDRRYITKRDNFEMQSMFFIIYSNSINLNKLINRIGFLYNSKRKESASKAARIVENRAKKEIIKNKKYLSAIKLRKKGLSAYKIAKELNIETHLIKNWMYHNTKPRLFSENQ